MRTLALVASLLLMAPPLAATVVVPAEFSEIVSGSQIIVCGRIADVRPEWTDGRRRIESVVTVAPSSFLRGTPTAMVTFRVPGGQMGTLRSVTVGAPQFMAGEEVVLFLRAQGPSMPQVFGLHQGVFRVRLDARTGARTVAMPILMGQGDQGQRVVRGAADRRPLALDQFAQTVRAVLQRGGDR